MAVNEHHTEVDNDGNATLPLHQFFLSLRQDGFLVTPGQLADSHSIIARYAGQLDNEAALGDYLSPIFASNEEEQIKFKEIFQKHYLQSPIEIATDIPGRNKLAGHFRKHWWKYLVLIVLTTVVVILATKSSAPVTKLSLVIQPDPPAEAGQAGNPFSLSSNDVLKVSIEPGIEDSAIAADISLVSLYDWGDDSKYDSSGQHSYALQGNYQLQAIVQVHRSGKFQYVDTLRQVVSVCDQRGTLSIQGASANDSVEVGQKLRLMATITGIQPGRFEWYADEQFLKAGNVLDTVFTDDGERQFVCFAVFDSLGGPCTASKLVNFTVYDREKPVINASVSAADGAKTLLLQRKVKPWLFVMLGFFFLGSFPAMIWFNKWKRRPQREQAEQAESVTLQYNELVSNFSGKRPPFDLPFRNRNNVLRPEPVLSEVAWQMRRRIDDETTYLHLNKTIRKAVRNAGYFSPVKVPRTHQSEYLVLIDETIVNNQQVRLFELVVDILRRQNVFIDKFYYRKELMVCYNSFEPSGMSLDKLGERFPKHVLLVFGSGEQLIYPHYPVFDAAYQQLLRRWKYKAILTPAPVKDWGIKEKVVLSQELMVVPADLYGQFLLLQHLFSGESIREADLNEYGDEFYTTSGFDFEDVDELINYCEQAPWARSSSGIPADNVLFQWIAALALYPRIRWELILSIGKTILESHGLAAELNFANLLRITRIQWMKDGRFPDFTRLELLKKLKVQHEVLGRETILAMLNEIPADEITKENFVFEEKEIQRIINEFNLYVYDPVKYIGYVNSKMLFEKLWQDKKILDSPAKVYLKNEQRSWSTLLQVKSASGESAEDRSLEDYLQTSTPEENRRVRSLRDWGGFGIAVVFLVSFLGLIGLTILNFVNSDSLQILTKKQPARRDIRFNITDQRATKSPDTFLEIDSASYRITADTIRTSTLIDNAVRNIAVRVNGDMVWNASMRIDKEAYNINISETPVASQDEANIVTRILLPQGCTGSIYDYRANIHSIDPRISIMDSTVSTVVDASKSCLNEIAFGKMVSIQIVTRIIENFKSSGISLSVSERPPFVVSDREIAIYHRSAAVEAVPTINIHFNLSDESLKGSLTSFSRELTSKGFNVASVQVETFNQNSEIQYFSQEVVAQARSIQQLYRKYYPDLPIPLKLNKNSRLTGSPMVIQIYIKKLQTKTKPVPAQEYESKGQTNIATPKDGMAYSKQGISYYNEKNYDLAIQELTEATRLNENDAYSFYYLGMSLNAQYKYEQAIDAFSKALSAKNKYFPQSFQAKTYLNRGLAKQKVKGEEGSCEDFRMAAKLGDKEAERLANKCY